VASHHGDVMLKAVPGDERQQFTEAWHGGDSNAAIHGEWVVGER